MIMFIFILFKEFMASHPSLIQIKSKIEHYNSIEQDAEHIKPVICLMSTELSTGKDSIMYSRQQPDKLCYKSQVIAVTIGSCCEKLHLLYACNSRVR